MEAPLEILRGLSPGLVRQFLPILDQLLPIYLDVANGKQDFTPSPTETRRLIQSSYGAFLPASQCSSPFWLVRGAHLSLTSSGCSDELQLSLRTS